MKIAVHCHAGTGRTGVAIAAWLVYGERMKAVDAIKLF
jgi:protein tyrosine phosphatase domain-containing protein 1